MPSPNPQSRLLPSVLDRLTDPDSMGSPTAPGYSEREMLRAVRADVEDLLNTRQTADGTRPLRDPITGEPVLDPQTRKPAVETFPEVANSVATYGLIDLVSYGGAASYQFTELAKMVAETIARFEPRLRKVKVTVVPAPDNDPRSVRFHIDAELNVDPAPEVGFVTVLELTTGRATVRSAGDGP
jgi:type VI secretion system protein ImpF